MGEKQSAMSTSKGHAAVEQEGKPSSRNAIADPAWLAWKRANSPGPFSLGGIPTNPNLSTPRPAWASEQAASAASSLAPIAERSFVRMTPPRA